MNKIEVAISDLKQTIKERKLFKNQVEAEIYILDGFLLRLQKIQSDNSIPHVEILSSEVKEIPCNVVNLEPSGTSGTTIMGKSNIGATKFTNIDAMNMYTHIPKNTDIPNTK